MKLYPGYIWVETKVYNYDVECGHCHGKTRFIEVLKDDFRHTAHLCLECYSKWAKEELT